MYGPRFPGFATDEIEGRAKGGYARAAKLSAEQKSEIAKKAAAKRWSNRPSPDEGPRVLESFKGKVELAGMSLPCAVVMGPNGVQRVLSESGITNAILGDRSGFSKRAKKVSEDGGALVPLFIAPARLKPYITNELLDGPLKPIDYLDGTRTVRGYDASVLTAVCNIWLKARAVEDFERSLRASVLTKAIDLTGYYDINRMERGRLGILRLDIRRRLRGSVAH